MAIQLLGPDPLTDGLNFVTGTLAAESTFTSRVPSSNRLVFSTASKARVAMERLKGTVTNSGTPYVYTKIETFGGDITRTSNAATGTITISINIVTDDQTTQLANELAYICWAALAQWRTSSTPYANQPTYYKTVSGGDAYNAFLDNVSDFRIIPPEETPGGRWAWGMTCIVTLKIDINPANM